MTKRKSSSGQRQIRSCILRHSLVRYGRFEWCSLCGYETPQSAARPIPLRDFPEYEPVEEEQSGPVTSR